ncbi:MAG: site-specific DNA-methyltransferase [Sporichthyaceae bacterium]|nr:site-specific DNA-methyltransferase [Sporichthyaceae bacterium]
MNPQPARQAEPHPYYRGGPVALYLGDAHAVLSTMPADSVDAVVTSPPYYGLRDYATAGQYGLEATPGEYVHTMARVFAQVRRVLRAPGTLWLVLGDCYSLNSGGAPTSGWQSGYRGRATAEPGLIRPRAQDVLPAKNLLGIPWRVAFALQDQGWTLRQAVIWHKPNAIPESVRDRPSCTHEYVFLLAKSRRYHFDLDPIRIPLAHPEAADGTRVIGGVHKGQHGGVGSTVRWRGRHAWGQAKYATDPAAHRLAGERVNLMPTGARHTNAHPKGRNPGSVWSIPTRPTKLAHFAAFPIDLPLRCIAAGCPPGGVVLDPFSGIATTGIAALQLERRYLGIDIRADYHDLAITRLGPLLGESGEST